MTFGKLSKEVLADTAAKRPADQQGLRQLHGLSRWCHGLGRAVGNRMSSIPADWRSR